MNKQRRKQIDAAKQRLAALIAEAEALRLDVEGIRDDEQDYRDAIPESLADSEKAQKADSAIEAFDQVIDALDSFINCDADALLSDAAA